MKVAEFIAKIRDISSEILDLRFTIEEAIIIHTLHSLDTHFKLFLAVPSHDSREKEYSSHCLKSSPKHWRVRNCNYRIKTKLQKTILRKKKKRRLVEALARRK